MNTRLAQAYQSGAFAGIQFTNCTTCHSSYPLNEVCAMCAPDDPRGPDTGMPVICEYNHTIYEGIITGINSKTYQVNISGILIDFNYSSWLVTVWPDFTKPHNWTKIPNTSVLKLTPTNCCNPNCNRPNEFDSPANEGSNWRCGQCRAYRDMYK